MVKKNLFLIDANAFCYRAFYALKGLRTSSGQATNAVYGFISILNKILKEQKPDYLACCFDVGRQTFRQAKLAQYKMHRHAMPDDLVSQIPIIKKVIGAYGIPIFEKAGYEADDIIAHLAKAAASKKIPVIIVSSDKDILQLVNENISVFNPYKDDGTFYDPAKVRELFGVAPGQVVDVMSLMGDASDNIPGVPGVGDKTAKKLILEFGSLEKLIKSIPEIQPIKLRQALENHIEDIRLNKELVSLDQEVDIKLDLKNAKVGKKDTQALSGIFRELEFRKLLTDLPGQEEKTMEETVLCDMKRPQLRNFLKSAKEIVISGSSAGSLIFGADAKVFDAGPCRQEIEKILADRSVGKSGHDLKKLKAMLSQEGVVLNGISFDTMIAAYLLNPSKTGYKIIDLALEYLNQFIKEDQLKDKDALSLLLKLKPVLSDALKEKGLSKLFTELEMPLVDVLAQMEMDGIKIDTELLKKLSGDIEKRLIKLIDGIYEAAGTQFNINSPKQLGQVLFEKLKLPVVKRTKTGPSTDEEVLRRLQDKHQLPVFLLEYRQLSKLKNTYVDALPKLVDPKTGRVHTSFNQTGTETGRLSSSSPNLQNIPVKTEIGSKIRQAIIASGQSSCLLSCDYSQVELRVLAHLSKDKTLVDAFNANRDIHRLTASLIYNVAEDCVSEPMREVAKRVNFGIVYGQSAFGLSKDLDIPVKEAQNFIDAYFLRYPKVKEYIEDQVRKAREHGFVTTLFGRRRYLPEINNKNIGIRQFAERQAANTPIQGTASDLIKMAMIKIFEGIKAENLEAKMILQIHDELVFELPLSELNTLYKLVKDRMENVVKFDVPIKVDIKKGLNWLEMKNFSVSKEICQKG